MRRAHADRGAPRRGCRARGRDRGRRRRVGPRRHRVRARGGAEGDERSRWQADARRRRGTPAWRPTRSSSAARVSRPSSGSSTPIPRRRWRSSATAASSTPTSATCSALDDPTGFFYPNYTSIHRIVAARSGRAVDPDDERDGAPPRHGAARRDQPIRPPWAHDRAGRAGRRSPRPALVPTCGRRRRPTTRSPTAAARLDGGRLPRSTSATRGPTLGRLGYVVRGGALVAWPPRRRPRPAAPVPHRRRPHRLPQPPGEAAARHRRRRLEAAGRRGLRRRRC